MRFHTDNDEVDDENARSLQNQVDGEEDRTDGAAVTTNRQVYLDASFARELYEQDQLQKQPQGGRLVEQTLTSNKSSDDERLAQMLQNEELAMTYQNIS